MDEGNRPEEPVGPECVHGDGRGQRSEDRANAGQEDHGDAPGHRLTCGKDIDDIDAMDEGFASDTFQHDVQADEREHGQDHVHEARVG